MIENFVKAWDKNKKSLEEYIKTTPQSKYSSYKKLVELLFTKVINPFLEEVDEDVYLASSIHVIDDGDYQGSQIFVIPTDTYQPSPYDYVLTYHSYGSCSGCDLLMGISNYQDGTPTDSQVKKYMKLFLNLLQSCKYLIGKDNIT